VNVYRSHSDLTYEYTIKRLQIGSDDGCNRGR